MAWKIGLLSDTHIPERALSLPGKIHDIFIGVDVILHAGDHTCEDVIIELETIAPVESVLGNMDSFSSLDLPEFRILEYEGVKIGLCHGTGNRRNIMDRMLALFRPYGVDVIVFGHTHRGIITQKEGIYLINPGTAADRMFSNKTSVAVLDVENGKVLNAELFEIEKDAGKKNHKFS